MRPRRHLTEEQRRSLLIRQGELTALAQHPSFPVLQAVIDERMEKFRAEVMAMVLGGDGLPLERQAFIRGFIKGCEYVLTIPTHAEARLEDVLRESSTEEAA